MTRHHSPDAGLDGRDERRQVAAGDLVHRPVDGGDHVVAVVARAAVTREVLRARRDPGGLQSGHGCRRVPGHDVRVSPERPGADDRVVGGGVDVHGRREVQVDAEFGQVVAECPVDGLGQGGIVDRAQGRVARIGRAGQVRDPRDVAALFVDRDQRLLRGRPQRGDQRRQLRLALDVRAEDRDPGQALAQRGQHPARRGEPGERRDQQGVGQPGQRGVGDGVGSHPFTAPATSPPTSRRRTTRKKIITGIVYKVDAAMIGPHWAPPRPKK